MSGQAHSVKRHLRVDADEYDAQIRRFIPHYEEMIATGVEVLSALAPAESHILDLGGGTGALSAAVLAGVPGARVTVLDVDGEMLTEARRRLAEFGDRVSFEQASFLDPLPAADAVVASLALHHVHDLDTKTTLYRAIRDALSPGGVLLNLECRGERRHPTEPAGVRPDGCTDGRSRHHRRGGAPALRLMGG